MSVTVTCPHCSHDLSVSDEQFAAAMGRTTRCRHCQKTYVVKDERKAIAVAASLARMQQPEVIDPPAIQSISIPSATLPAAAPPTPQFQCVVCTGWFDSNRIYASGDGTYICMRCHQPAASPLPAPYIPQQTHQQPVVINNVINNNAGPLMAPRWNSGVAALLSFLLPGLGQMYKGQPINGLFWLILTAIGYVFFIVPGIVLHLCCIIGASMGDPYRR